MPYKSTTQIGKCFALKARGQNGSWDCNQWARETPDTKSLPERVPKFSGSESVPKRTFAKHPPKKNQVKFGGA